MRGSYRLGGNIRNLVAASAAVIALGLTVPPVSAQNANSGTSAAPAAAIAALPAAKPKTAQSSSKPYFIEFRARAAQTYGHMYVLYGQVNGHGEIVKSDIAGHHPAGDRNDCENCSVFSWSIGHILFVPAEVGASDGDLEEKYVSARYRVMLDAESYKKVAAHIGKLKADPPLWNALWRNCVAFGNGIAEVVGLKTPGAIWMEPKDYVEGLRFLNGGTKQGPLKYAAPGAVKTSSLATAPAPASTAKTSTAAPSNSATPIPPQKPNVAATTSASAKPKKQSVASAPAPAPAPEPAPAVALPAYTPQ